jgi:hypothetical protein
MQNLRKSALVKCASRAARPPEAGGGERPRACRGRWGVANSRTRRVAGRLPHWRAHSRDERREAAQLDNGRRSPRKLLRAVVAQLFGRRAP